MAEVRRSKREQRDESIGNLLAAARSLFVSKGYRAGTLEQIATATGLTKGAVLRWQQGGGAAAGLLTVSKRGVIAPR